MKVTTKRGGGNSGRFRRWKAQDGQVCVDVGASIGQSTGEIISKGKDVRIIAIEPGKEALSRFRYKSHPRVTLVPIGVSDKQGLILFSDYKVRDADQGYFVEDNPIHDIKEKNTNENRIPSPTTYKVFVDTLDNILDDLNIDTVDFLKMDIEGHEVQALSKFTKFKKGTLFHIEYHSNLDGILAWLNENSITVVEIVKWSEENERTGEVYAVK